MSDIISVGERSIPNPDEPSSTTVTDALKKTNQPFNHELFRRRLIELRDSVMETGGIVFFPLVWGSPYPEEYFTENNQLGVNYDPDVLTTYESHTLRDPVPHKEKIGPFIVQDYTSEPDPMLVKDVEERVKMVQSFQRLRFPTKPSKFNQVNYNTAMTDESGNVSVSLNCPYGLNLDKESPVRYDSDLPVSPLSDFTARVYYAAYLRAMGCSDDLIYKAVAFQPKSLARETGNTFLLDEEQEALRALNEVPPLDTYLKYDHITHKSKWTPPPEISVNPVEVHRAIITTAHFLDNGNVGFELTLKPPQPKQLS